MTKLTFRDPDFEQDSIDLAPELARMQAILRDRGYFVAQECICRAWRWYSEDTYAAGFYSINGLSDESIFDTLMSKCHLVVAA